MYALQSLAHPFFRGQNVHAVHSALLRHAAQQSAAVRMEGSGAAELMSKTSRLPSTLTCCGLQSSEAHFTEAFRSEAVQVAGSESAVHDPAPFCWHFHGSR